VRRQRPDVDPNGCEVREPGLIGGVLTLFAGGLGRDLLGYGRKVGHPHAHSAGKTGICFFW